MIRTMLGCLAARWRMRERETRRMERSSWERLFSTADRRGGMGLG